MNEPATKIRFPVLRRLSVEKYQMFPGIRGKGINHSFVNGVTIIAGINGLGKTTLLNAIFRVMAGPRDWRIEGDADFGAMPHTLRPWRTPSYFRARVGNEADNATISAVITFGAEQLSVTRSLRVRLEMN